MAMPCRTHRSRLLVLLLLLLSPGLGGRAVRMVHPCSADASQTATHGGTDRSSHPEPARDGQDAGCHCFGTCYIIPTLQAATAPPVAAPKPTLPLTVRRPLAPERLVAPRLTLLQPPGTAPPLLS